MKHKNVISAIITIILSLAPLAAASEPTWYSISAQGLAIGGDLYNNSVDI